MKNINSKAKSYELYHKGVFGNKLRTWTSYEEICTSNYNGTVSMRYAHKFGTFYAYEVKIAEIPEIQMGWVENGALLEHIVFNESAPDHHLVIQGMTMRNRNGCGLYLCYSDKKAKFRDVLDEMAEVTGLKAKMLIQGAMTSSSYEDLQALFDIYSDSIVEFSTYSCLLGSIPGRNTIIWEVRNY